MTEFDSGINKQEIDDTPIDAERSQSSINDEIKRRAWINSSLGKDTRLDLIRSEVTIISRNGDATNVSRKWGNARIKHRARGLKFCT